MLLPRERVDRILLLIHLFDRRGTPSGTSSHRERASAETSTFVARTCQDLEDLGRLNPDDFRFAKRISGLLRGYDHKYLLPHHKIIPPEFDNQLYLNFENMYSYMRKRYRAQLSRQDLYLILKTQDRFMCRIEAGVVGELTTLGHAVSHHSCEGLPRT